MAYNATATLNNMTSSGGLTVLGQTINQTVLGGWVGIVIYVMIVIIAFLSMKTRGIISSGAFVSSTFLGFVISLLLSAVNLIPMWFLYINIAFVAITGIILVFQTQ